MRYGLLRAAISRHLKDKYRKATTLEFYIAMSVPTFVKHGPQTNVRKAAEMRFQEVVKGCRRSDRFRNSDIRAELNIDSLQNRIHEYIRNCSAHIDMTNTRRLPLKIRRYTSVEVRSLGKLRKR